jgi:hypothetical protein
MWTDSELDQALADQPAGPAFSPAARARALAALRTADAAPVSARRTGKAWWLAAAAAVAAVTGGAATFLTGGPAPQASAAAVQSLQLASNVVGDVQVGPGQYYYIGSHSWALGAAQTRAGHHLDAMVENTDEEWIPANRSDVWLKRGGYTGHHTWLIGSDEIVKAEGDGGLFEPVGQREQRGACGDWGGRQTAELGGSPDDGKPCDQRTGDWNDPTPAFVAQLPTDPAKVYAKLDADAKGDKTRILENAVGVLQSSYVDRDVRSTVYKALMLLPGLDVTDNAATLDGQRGVALGATNENLRQEIVLDPATGRYLGERLVLAVDGTGFWQGLKAGTVIESTSVRTAVAEKIGVAPR